MGFSKIKSRLGRYMTATTPEWPERQLTLWPHGRPMAAVLTHDVDLIYDRELFRVLANLNRLRRLWFGQERGQKGACLHRLARSLLHPKNPGKDIRRLRALERRYGFPSTFFLLEDRYWARHGARYRWEDPVVRRIAAELAEEGCELGIHGSYYDFSDSNFLRRQRERFESIFGVTAAGIRNHYLRFNGVCTWEAQENAGFAYDSTYGFNKIAGTRGGLALPFFPHDPANNLHIDVLELPLTIMDTTVFGWMGLDAQKAAEMVQSHIEDLVRSGGMGVFVWHNNYFDEPEYYEYEEVYGVLLSALYEAKAWVTTGEGLQSWWRTNAPISIIRDIIDREEQWSGTVLAKQSLDGFCMGFSVTDNEVYVEASETRVISERQGRQVLIRLPQLEAGDVIRLRVTGVGPPTERC